MEAGVYRQRFLKIHDEGIHPIVACMIRITAQAKSVARAQTGTVMGSMALRSAHYVGTSDWTSPVRDRLAENPLSFLLPRCQQQSFRPQSRHPIVHCWRTTTPIRHNVLPSGSLERPPAGRPSASLLQACPAPWLRCGCLGAPILPLRNRRCGRRQDRHARLPRPDHQVGHRGQGRNPIPARPGPDRRSRGVRIQGTLSRASMVAPVGITPSSVRELISWACYRTP